jgi:hypothetical protein
MGNPCSIACRSITAATCLNGHLDCLKAAHKLVESTNGNEMLLAVRKGHLDCLIYCHENGFRINSYLAYEAIFNRNVDCLEYILEKHLDNVTQVCLMKLAAFLNDLDCIKCLYKYGYKWTQNSSIYLGVFQHTECLKFIYYMYRDNIRNEEINEWIIPKIDRWKSLVNIVRCQTRDIPADIWNIMYTYW